MFFLVLYHVYIVELEFKRRVIMDYDKYEAEEDHFEGLSEDEKHDYITARFGCQGCAGCDQCMG